MNENTQPLQSPGQAISISKKRLRRDLAGPLCRVFIKRCWCLALFQVYAFAAGPWTISAPCAPAQCTATVLNDHGDIAGERFDTGSGVDGRGFEIVAGALIQPLNPQGGQADYVLPHWINSAGVLAIEYGNYLGPSIAGLFEPGSASLVDLNSVFSWAGPARALTVNDSGAVAAISSNPADSESFILPFGAGFYFAILNNQVSVSSPNLNQGASIWAPWVVNAPSTGPIFLKEGRQVVGYSTGGHVLERDPGESGIPGFYIYTPGVGERQLAVFREHPFAINDSDELLMHFEGDDYFWDRASPPQRLRDLIDPRTEWTSIRGLAINNRGQILVEARQSQVTTSLVLSPPGLVASDLQARAQGFRIESVNGQAIRVNGQRATIVR